MIDQFRLIRDDYTNIEEAFNGDLWNREELAIKLTSYISRLKIGATLAIDAEWGSGKTWFVNHWKKYLENQKFNVIYLDAFANDYLEDPFLIISMEIANKIKADETQLENFKHKFSNAYHAILPHLPILLWSLTTTLLGAGYFGKTTENIIKNLTDTTGDFGEKSAELLNEKLKEHLTSQVENYEKEKQALVYFKEALIDISKDLKEPLVFIIDELDRCKPEFSIRLIERIKHFFDTPNIIFVLAINKKQLSESINSFYGFNSNNSYLEKFIDFNIKLSIPDEYDYEELIRKYIQTHGFTTRPITSIKMLFIYFQPNARQVIKILQKLNFLNIQSSRKATYACLHILIKDLGLNKNSENEFEFIEIFIEKAKNYYTSSIDFDALDPNDLHFEEKFIKKLSMLGNDISVLGRLYKAKFIDHLEDETNHLKDALLPTQNSNHLVKDWDKFINSGFMTY